MIVKRQKEFGGKSKALGILSPGAWSGKELAKLTADNEEDYEKRKWKSAKKGAFGSNVTARKFQKAQELAAKGYSPKKIREELGRSESFGKIAGETAVRMGVGAITPFPFATSLAFKAYPYYVGYTGRKKARRVWGDEDKKSKKK